MWEVGVYIRINQDLKNMEKKRNLGIKILPSEYRIIHMNEALPVVWVNLGMRHLFQGNMGTVTPRRKRERFII